MPLLSLWWIPDLLLECLSSVCLFSWFLSFSYSFKLFLLVFLGGLIAPLLLCFPSPGALLPKAVSLVLSCFVLFGFGFLGLSCCGCYQMHCEFKASVPVPAVTQRAEGVPQLGCFDEK